MTSTAKEALSSVEYLYNLLMETDHDVPIGVHENYETARSFIQSQIDGGWRELVPLKGITLGAKLTGKITEAEALELINSVIDTQNRLMRGELEPVQFLDSDLPPKPATEGE